MSDWKAAGSGTQPGLAGIDLIWQVAALSRKRNGKLEKTIYSVKELFFDVLFQNAQTKF